MNIPKIGNYPNKKQRKSQKAPTQNFTATPAQILAKIKTANMASGQKNFLTGLAEFFLELQAQMPQIQGSPSTFSFKLGEPNIIPKKLAEAQINECSLEGLDKCINGDVSKDQKAQGCKLCVGQNKGQLTRGLLQALGVENPDVITISK